MIRNILERHHCTIKLDKVIKDIPGGGFQVIDEPAAVLSEVRDHFQQWTSKHQVQPLSGRWIDVYKPMEVIDPQWYNGLMVSSHTSGSSAGNQSGANRKGRWSHSYNK